MPEICRFLGIVIKMFFDNLEKIDGNLPPRVQELIIEWHHSTKIN